MIYKDANERAQDIKAMSEKASPYRVATVTAVSGSNATIRFRGESSASTKTYKRLSSYSPTAGDTVLLLSVSNTFVILGKII